ncbi:MAG: CPBP family glutamic-type intramembrane protease [Acidobacteriota bacterium]|nr:CPBP family glutamic-type intramembrane protease [Acidobacteriota bacterium]
MLGNNHNNPLLPAGFVLMVICPFVFFTKAGRRLMSLTKPTSRMWMFWGILLGGLAATICFLAGYLLFGYSADNWFVTVKTYYATSATGMPDLPFWALFLVFTIPALLFSPFGEEFFFRGFSQTTLEQRFAPNHAMLIVALAFGAIHLFHHGIAQQNGEFQVHFVSGSIWFGLIFGTSILFEICRRRAGSIWAAVVCHMSFNLFMNLFIFTFLSNART